MDRLVSLMRALSGSDDVAYVLAADRTILRTNQGWSRFALANGGASTLDRWPRGACIDDAIPEPLRAFYLGAFSRALASGERWEHDYECSSAETYRRFRMVAYPVEQQWLVVVNSLIMEEAMAREVCAPCLTAYEADGVIGMCSHCRRVRNPAGHQRWDWVPAYVRSPPRNLSHGLCEPCYAFYWGGDDDELPPP